MKKKLTATAMAVITLLGTTAFAAPNWYEAEFSDPFNNDLFEVVSEIKFSDEIKEKYPNITQSFFGFGGVEGFEINTNQFTALNGEEAVNIKIDYDGNAYVTGHELIRYEDEYADDEGIVTDGLAPYYWIDEDEIDPMYSMPHTTYKDINGNEVVDFDTWYCTENYSCGLIHLVRDMNSGVLSGDTITYIYNPWEDGKEYHFKGSIYEFDDNGYGIYNPNNEMECTVNDKYYVIKLKKGIIPSVTYNGEKIVFDQIPVIENGRTLVPLRAIFEKIGADVNWNGDTQTVTAGKDDTEISLTINSTIAVKNGENITLDVPAKVLNGRTLVPVRFVADCFGVNVDWDGTMQRVSLTSK